MREGGMASPMAAFGSVSSWRNIFSLMDQDDRAEPSMQGVGLPRVPANDVEEEEEDAAEDRLRCLLSDLSTELEQWISCKNMLLAERNMLRNQLWRTSDLASEVEVGSYNSNQVDGQEFSPYSPTTAPPHHPSAPSDEPAVLPLRLATTSSPRPSVDDVASSVSGETATEAASRLRRELGRDVSIVCILGGTEFRSADSEALVKEMASKLEAAVGSKARFVTGGMAGVQETFAMHCGDGARVWNLLPVGQSSGYGRGEDINAGADLEERKAIFGLIGDIYITVEGGPGVSQEARAAHARGAAVVPLMRTGGASNGMFDFPQGALQKPCFCTETQWSLLASKDAPAQESAAAVAAVVEACVGAAATKEHQIMVQSASTSGVAAATAKGPDDEREKVPPPCALTAAGDGDGARGPPSGRQEGPDVP